MLKPRNIIIILLLSGFVIGLTSFIMEYLSVNKKIANVDYTIQNALDMSIQQCIMSDDFYLDGFNYGSTSEIASDGSDVTNAGLWVHGSLEDKNMLDAIMKYNESGYDGMKYARSTEYIKTSMSNGGDIFKRNAFDWQYNTNEFKEFYLWVRDTGFFKTKIYYIEDGQFEQGYASTLDLMGLSDYGTFDNVRLYSNGDIGNNARTGKIITDSSENEEVTNVEKQGYYGSYMLTPSALGITYINKDMLIPVIKSNLEMICANAFVTVDNPNSRLDNNHRGCTKVNYYSLSHKVGVDEYIVNNGIFEIDLNSVDVDIEYKAVDMFNSANNKILDLALGAKKIGVTAGEDLYNGDRASFIKNQYNIGSEQKYIIVAKIDVSLKVHIPLTTPLLQLYRSYEGGNNNHLDIKRIDSTNKSNYASDSGEGVYYTYTTYTAVTP